MEIKRNTRLIKLFSLFLFIFIFEFIFVCPVAADPHKSVPDSPVNEQKIINYIINTDESAVVDKILYHALQRIGYSMTMDAMPMYYAIQMANSGERDALALQEIGTERRFSNLVMVPEEIFKVGFQVYVKKGSNRVFNSWDDLAGLVVGHLFQKTYIINHLPKNIAGSIQRETFYDLNLALLAGECDVIVSTSTLDQILICADGIVYANTIDRSPSFTFLNKKFDYLVPSFANSLAEMKADGTYDKIVNDQWRSPDHNPTVLHISSYYAEDLWDARFKDGVTAKLNVNEDISYYNVPLYSNRFRSEYEQARNAYYSFRTGVMRNPPDVIIASDRSAVSFVCNYYSILFKNIPVILFDVNGEIDHLWQLGGNYTAIWGTIPAAETSKMIQKLFPKTTDIFVVNDYSANGAPFRACIEQELGSNFGGMNITYNKNLSHDDLISEISALKENTAVIIGHYSTDVDGIYHPKAQLHSLVSANASIPVFGMHYGCIGSGQIGGKYIDPLYYGEAAGEIALDIIMRKLPAIKEDTMDNTRFIFDESVIKSYKVNKKLLPKGADFINHKPTMYESNPQAFIFLMIIGALGLLTITGLSITVLLIRKKDRRLYEKTITISEQKTELDNLKNILNRLNVMVCVTNPKTDELLFINDYMKNVLDVEDNWAGKKCYKVMRKLDKRCDFCPCTKLDIEPNQEIIWEQHYPITNRIYRNYSRYIKWPGGKTVHLQNSLDITDLKHNAKILDKRLEQQSMMTDISKSFFSNEDIDVLITKALQRIGEFMGIAQILFFKLDNNGTRLICEYEWINPATNKPSRIGSAMPMSDAINDLLGVLKKYNKNFVTVEEPGVKALMEPYRLNYQNYLLTSILFGEVMYAALDFSRDNDDKWSREEINTASLFTNILTGVLQKQVLIDHLIKEKRNHE